MAQVKPFNWYEQESAPGIAGQKADTTVDIVDSFAVEGGVDAGELVIRGTDPQKQVKALAAVSDVDKVVGVVVHDHAELPESGKMYAEGKTVGVMTMGDIYVEVADDVVAGDAVYVAEVSSAIAFVAADYSSAAAVPGMTYLDNGADGDIVRIRVRK